MPFGTDLVKAQWAYQSAQEGKMIIMNSGRAGSGFVKCGECGYATSPKNGVPATHNNPYTGLRCSSAINPFVFHLSHTFHTDVLQIRVHHHVPIPSHPASASAEEVEKLQQGVSRSITEAVRLAACDLIGVPENELSATYRLKIQGLEVILHDAISGGAGYSKKIQEVELSRLLKHARDKILNCSAGCSDSCSKCLRSYSNQAYWDDFKRHEADSWLKDVLKLKSEDPKISMGAREISPQKLEELCNQASKIILIRRAVGDFVSRIKVDEATRAEVPLSTHFKGWHEILKLLSSEIAVHIHSAVSSNYKDPKNSSGLRMAEAMLPHVRDGRLLLTYGLSAFTGGEPNAIIENAQTGEATLVYSTDYIGSSLDSLWAGSILVRTVKLEEVPKIFNYEHEVSIEDLTEPAGVTRKMYAMNQARDIKSDFSFIAENNVNSVHVVDRYMFADDHNCDALYDFLIELASTWKEKPTIKLSYGPAGHYHQGQDWNCNAQSVLQSLLQRPEMNDVEIRLDCRDHRDAKGDKHDRMIFMRSEREVAQESGTEDAPRRRGRRSQSAEAKVIKEKKTFVAELTGGISHLMGEDHETRIFSWVRQR